MKKLRLLVASLFIAGGAFAQVVGTHYEPNLTVTPLGATPNDVITITIDASTSCNDNVGGITGWSNANIHTGTILDTTMWSGWTNVVNWNAGPQTAFTETPSGSGIWKISFKPVDFYSVPTGIQGIAFVVNGGTSLADPSPWDHNARAFGDATLTNGTCGDFFVPFPIPAKLARTSGFAAQTERER